jgi:hypothetical protein
VERHEREQPLAGERQDDRTTVAHELESVDQLKLGPAARCPSVSIGDVPPDRSWSGLGAVVKHSKITPSEHRSPLQDF